MFAWIACSDAALDERGDVTISTSAKSARTASAAAGIRVCDLGYVGWAPTRARGAAIGHVLISTLTGLAVGLAPKEMALRRMTRDD